MTLRISIFCFFVIHLTVAIAFAEPAAQIPVESFFKNPTMSGPRLSPEGRHIAFVFSQNDTQRIFVRRVAGKEAEGLVEFPMRTERLTSVEWANPRRLIMSAMVSTPGAKEGKPSTTRLYGISRERPRLERFGENWPKRGPGWPVWQVRFEDKVINLLPSERDYVLVSHLEFGERTPSVSRLNVTSGRLRVREPATQGISEWYVDPQGAVRAAEALGQSSDRKSYVLLARRDANQPLEPVFASYDYHTSRYRFAGFHETPNLLYVIADHEGRDALYQFDIDSAALGDLVFAHPEFDVTAAYFSEARKRVVGARFTGDEPQIAFFDADAEKEQALIDRAMLKVQPIKTVNRIVSATDDGNLTIIEVSNPTQPPAYYGYDRMNKKINFIFDQRPDIPVDQLAAVKRIDFAARDATMIPGYLTLPKDHGAGKLPMIVLPHDGPSARDAMVYNPVVQFFANRGYAVLQVNYRGSSGFGREFRLAGNPDWGGVIQRDIADGVKWAIEQGIADADRIGIFGTGYGGYSALMGLVTTPDLYRAGASHAALTDLELIATEDGNFLWEMGMGPEPQTDGETGGEKGGGTNDEIDREGLARNSPLRRIDEIRVPVLLAHGVKDTRVNVVHARMLERALSSAGKDVKYLEYADEFEDFVLESSRIDFYTQLLSFFDTYLAVDAQPAEAASASDAEASQDASPEPAPETSD